MNSTQLIQRNLMRKEEAYFTLHHNLDLSRLNNIETISLVALWKERENT